MLTVYSGYVKGCHKSLSCKSGFKLYTTAQGPVVRRSIGTYPGFKFNPGFSLLCSKACSPIIVPVICRAFNHQLVDKKN